MENIGSNTRLLAIRFGLWVRSVREDQRGLTVSAVILIGILVVAVAAFGAIAANKIAAAGTEVENVTFD